MILQAEIFRRKMMKMMKNLSGGGMKWIPEKTKAPARQQGEKQKRAAKVDHGKICALRKAGWSVKEICAEMHISPATVFNHLKMEKGNEEEQGM